MINVSLFMRNLCGSIAECPYLSDEVADVLKDEFGTDGWRRSQVADGGAVDRAVCLVVVCSTSLRDSTRRVAQAIAAKRGRFLDAAMAGDFGYKTQSFPRLLSSFNRLSGAS